MYLNYITFVGYSLNNIYGMQNEKDCICHYNEFLKIQDFVILNESFDYISSFIESNLFTAHM